jgi:hypothetical protein
MARVRPVLEPAIIGMLMLGASCTSGPPLRTASAAPRGDACVPAPDTSSLRPDPVRPRGEEPMERWYFLYSCDLPFGSVVVTVFPAGESSVRLTVNLGAREEIGEYRRALPPEQVEPLRAALRDSRWSELPEPQPAMPGTPFVFMAEGMEGAPPGTRKSFPLADLPEQVLPVMKAMGPVIDAIREGAHRVLAGSAGFAQPEYGVGDDVVLDIALRNAGAMPVEIVNPAGALADEEVGLLLRIARDRPDEELRDDDVAAVEFARDSVRLAPRPGVEFEQPSTTVVLGTGEELRLRATKKVLLPAGRYKAVLTFANQREGIAAQQGAPGSLTLDLGTVTIR